jgi:hypothetical protein
MKNQLDQNPAEMNNKMQEENAEIMNQEENISSEAKHIPVEDQDENSNIKDSIATEPERDEEVTETEAKVEPEVAAEVKVKKPRKKKETVIAEHETKEPADDTVVAEPQAANALEEPVQLVTEDEPKAEIIFLDEESVAVDEEAEDEEVEEAEEESAILHLSRQELVELLEETVKEDDINSIRKKITLIRITFVKLQKEAQLLVSTEQEKTEHDSPEDELEKRFNQAYSVYRDKRQVFLDGQEVLKHKNLESKKIILEELKSLIDSEESLKKTYDEFKVLQEKWKDIGMVPKNEVNNLWQSYHFLVEKFFDKVKINKELRDLDLRKNLELKIELCEKTEELLLESSILKSFKKLQKYHQLWKETGPVPQDKKDDIWDRFKNATDKINQRRREHYDKLQESHENNLMAKTALCEKAEELIQLENNSIKDWQNHTDQIAEMMKVWKTIGPAPRKQNDDIWDRFKSTLDTFFTAKKEYFQKIKDEQLNNYNLKLDLCAQAESLKTSTNWRETTQELIKIQNDWRNIGPVPRKLSDKVWKRFRGACDEFFKAKSEFYTTIGKTESGNLKLKEDLIKKVTDFEYGDDKTANLETLKGFQREWTEIGHVPIKEKERLQNEFRTVINDQLDKLKISKAEMQNLNYRNRIESMKDTPNPDRMMGNEKLAMMNKKKKLEEEIKLWENNIGFFSNSKKSSVLKEEFERKIQSAKDEVKDLNGRIKLLDKEMN